MPSNEYLVFTFVSEGNIKELKKLKKRDANIIFAKTNDGNTPLLIAAMYGHLEIVKRLLQNGANITEKNAHGATILHCAAVNGHLEILQWLLTTRKITLDIFLEQQRGTLLYVLWKKKV